MPPLFSSSLPRGEGNLRLNTLALGVVSPLRRLSFQGRAQPVRIFCRKASSGRAPSKLVVSLITTLGTAITW